MVRNVCDTAYSTLESWVYAWDVLLVKISRPIMTTLSAVYLSPSAPRGMYSEEDVKQAKELTQRVVDIL